MNLACHHVIGWDVIWQFWNRLIEKKDFKLARGYLGIFNIPQASTAKIESDIRNNAFVAGAAWDAKMCWNPINIVRGPEDRSDDPNAATNRREKIDFQNAVASIYSGRVASLVSAGAAMCDYIEHNHKNKAEDAIAYLKSIRAADIMEWTESVWVVDKKHPGYSSVPALAGGFAVVRPRWRIVRAGTNEPA